MRYRCTLRIGLLVFALCFYSNAEAADDFWRAGLTTGNWEEIVSWQDLSPPTSSDAAHFNNPGNYNSAFGAAPGNIQALNVVDGTVTFFSSGSPRKLFVNSLSGSQDVNVLGAATTLILGTSGSPLHLEAGDSLSVQFGANLEARFGSQIVANNLGNATGLNGTITIDGAGSKLTVESINKQFIGANGSPAALAFQNGSLGNSLAGALGIADTAVAPMDASLSVLGGSSLSIAGEITLANQNVAGQTGTLTINGDGSQLTQSGAAGITVGSAANGTAAINIGTTADGGTLTTGTGTLTINKTGTVTLGRGDPFGSASELFANGDVMVDGGVFTRHAGGFFHLASEKTMTIQNGGRVNFEGHGSFLTAMDANYNVTGALSQLAVADFATIRNGGQVTVTSGGTLSAGATILIGAFDGDGTLIVDGSGSSAVVNGSVVPSPWGQGGHAAMVQLSNNATASFPGGIRLADDPVAGTTADVDILSGAILNVGDVLVASSGGATSAVLTISDFGSSVSIASESALTIGHELAGTAVIDVLDGASLTVGSGGTTTLKATGTINIDGGTVDLKQLVDNGGTINFTAGSLSYIGDLAVGTGGLLGKNLTLESNHQLTLSGTTTVDAGRTLAINGGTLNTDGLVVNGALAFSAGTLGITGAGGLTIGSGGPLGTMLTIGAGRTLNVTNTTTVNGGALLVLENGGDFTSGSVTNSGEIVLDGPAATFHSATVDNAGLLRGRGRIDALLNNEAAGEVRAATGELLQFMDAGSNLNSGRINLLGGSVEFAAALTNAASGQIVGHGSLIADGGIHNEGTLAFSGQTNLLGDVANQDGVVISAGGGPTTFFDDVVNDGEIRTSPGSFTVFFGAVSGAGTFTGTGTVNLEGELSPGSSAAIVDFGGDLVLGPKATTIMELGGTIPGSQYDRLQIAGHASFGGALDVELINDFAPAPGDSFDLFNWGTASGAFANLDLPTLNADLMWNTSQLATLGLLSVALAGDYNFDGTVDAADYVVWRKNDGSQERYDTWRAHFGQTAGSGSAGAPPMQPVVPEPTSLVLLLVATALHIARRPTTWPGRCCTA